MPRPSHNAYAYAFGDVPAVPSELRLPSQMAGGLPSKAREPVRTSEAIARSHERGCNR